MSSPLSITSPLNSTPSSPPQRGRGSCSPQYSSASSPDSILSTLDDDTTDYFSASNLGNSKDLNDNEANVGDIDNVATNTSSQLSLNHDEQTFRVSEKRRSRSSSVRPTDISSAPRIIPKVNRMSSFDSSQDAIEKQNYPDAKWLGKDPSLKEIIANHASTILFGIISWAVATFEYVGLSITNLATFSGSFTFLYLIKCIFPPLAIFFVTLQLPLINKYKVAFTMVVTTCLALLGKLGILAGLATAGKAIACVFGGLSLLSNPIGWGILFAITAMLLIYSIYKKAIHPKDFIDEYGVFSNLSPLQEESMGFKIQTRLNHRGYFTTVCTAYTWPKIKLFLITHFKFKLLGNAEEIRFEKKKKLIDMLEIFLSVFLLLNAILIDILKKSKPYG